MRKTVITLMATMLVAMSAQAQVNAQVLSKMAMTNLVFPSEPYNNLKVKGGKATIYEIKN